MPRDAQLAHARRDPRATAVSGRIDTPDARADEVGDEPHTFDLDRHAQLDPLGARRGLDLVAQRVARRRQDQRLARERRRTRSAPAPSAATPTARARRAPRRAGARRASRGSLTGSVTTALASCAFGDLAREPFGRALGEPQRQPRRGAPHLGDDHRARARRLTVPTTPSVACPVSRPCSIDRSLCSASISLRIARARSITRTPNSVGTVPRRPRTSSCTPSSASSWRTCSETFDCTVWSWSAAAVKLPVLGDGEQGLELANVHGLQASSDCRTRIDRAMAGRPRTGALAGLPIAVADRYYRFHAFDR